MSDTNTDLVAPSKYELFHLHQILESHKRRIVYHKSDLASDENLELRSRNYGLSKLDVIALIRSLIQESEHESQQIVKQLSREFTLLHHIITIRFLDESSLTELMAHKPNCSFPVNSHILHFPIDSRNKGIIGLWIGDKQKLDFGSGSREFEVVGIDFAELWQIHSHSREPVPRDTSDRPNYSPYHHGGE